MRGKDKTKRKQSLQNAPYSQADVLKAFLLKIKKAGPDECWEWQGSLNGGGYGHLRVHRKDVIAHRMAYMLSNGPIEVGKRVCHTCDNRRCCNPVHLWIGTGKDNSMDAARKLRMHSKYSVEDILKVKELLNQGLSTRAIAKRLSVGRDTVMKVQKGKTWAHL
jgi:hypothetical protein